MLLRTTSALGLSAMLLADAGVGSCNNGEKNVSVTFVMSASDCSCLPATLDVNGSGHKGPPPRVEVRCGASTPVTLSVQPSGSLFVTQAGSGVVWLDASYSADDGGQVPVSLKCPAR